MRPTYVKIRKIFSDSYIRPIPSEEITREAIIELAREIDRLRNELAKKETSDVIKEQNEVQASINAYNESHDKYGSG